MFIKLPSLDVFLLLTTSSILSTTAQQCDQHALPEDTCPSSNGFQEICICLPFGGGCWCNCPQGSERVDGGCSPLPTKLGEPCNYSASCGLIPGATCDSGKICSCRDALYPSMDLESCIPKPVFLGDPCSRDAPCQESIPASECALSGNQYECRCESNQFPNSNGTGCHPPPEMVGDVCSSLNPCSSIPSSACVERDGGQSEPTCQCWDKYVPNELRSRCVPTKIGLKCSVGSPCENIPGAECFGREEESICLCLWAIPNYDLDMCLGLKEVSD